MGLEHSIGAGQMSDPLLGHQCKFGLRKQIHNVLQIRPRGVAIHGVF